MNKKRIYISGKITGIEEEAKELFNEAEKLLNKNGFIAVNPLKLNHEHDKTWESYMKEDIKEMMQCDGVFILNNYWQSKGAIIEIDLALSLKMDFFANDYENNVFQLQQHSIDLIKFMIQTNKTN